MSEELALQLANDIIAAQGAAFVRELLRTLKQSGARVMVGVRKADTLGHLTDAIRAGVVSFDDLLRWLNDVEGWGREHVYLYSVTTSLSEQGFWREPVPDRFFDHVRASGLAIPREQKHVLDFPEILRLGRVAYDGERLDMVWRKKTMDWQRDSEMDEERIVDGDLYQFKAWRHTPDRSVIRFVLFPRMKRAALFVQVPLSEEHKQAVESARENLSRMFPLSGLRKLRISECVKELDHAGLDARGGGLPNARGSMRSRATSFGTYGATVSFSSSEDFPYGSVEPVRRVRRAVPLADFSGERAKFLVSLASGPGLNRQVMMSMDGVADRLYFYSRMSADEVWDVIDYVFLTSLGGS